MTRRSAMGIGLRLMGVVASSTALALGISGCGEEAPSTTGPVGKAREEASTKNMENFMKGKPTPIGPGADTKKPGGPQTK